MSPCTIVMSNSSQCSVSEEADVFGISVPNGFWVGPAVILKSLFLTGEFEQRVQFDPIKVVN